LRWQPKAFQCLCCLRCASALTLHHVAPEFCINRRLLGELGNIEAVGDNNELFGLSLQGRVSQLQLLQHNQLQELLGENSRVDVLADSDGDDLFSLLEELLSLSDSEVFVGLKFWEVKGGEGLTIVGVFFFLELRVGEDLILDAPLLAEELGDVVSDAVRKHQHNSLGLIVLPSLLLDEPDGRVSDCACGSTHKKALLPHQLAGIGQRGDVLSLIPAIDRFSGAGPGNKVVSNAFHLVGSSLNVEVSREGEDAADRISTNNDCTGASFFDFSGDSSNGSSCSDSDDYGIEVAIALVKDLFSQLVVVC
jgi:hypothetical protein